MKVNATTETHHPLLRAPPGSRPALRKAPASLTKLVLFGRKLPCLLLLMAPRERTTPSTARPPAHRPPPTHPPTPPPILDELFTLPQEPCDPAQERGLVAESAVHPATRPGAARRGHDATAVLPTGESPTDADDRARLASERIENPALSFRPLRPHIFLPRPRPHNRSATPRRFLRGAPHRSPRTVTCRETR